MLATLRQAARKSAVLGNTICVRTLQSTASTSEQALLTELERSRISFDLRAIQRRAIPSQPGLRNAACLVPFCHVEGVPSVLFTVRSKKASGSDNGGIYSSTCDVGFPGIRTDGSAPSAAAVEAGAAALCTIPQAIRILGAHHDCPDILSGTIITPVLGYLGEVYPAQLQVDPEYCSEVFALPVEELLSEKSLAVELDATLGPVPSFNHSGGSRRIWGPTAAILHGALRVAVGHSQSHKAALYEPFMRFAQRGAAAR